MKCPNCGKNIAGKVNFCPWCGYKDENGAMGEDPKIKKAFSNFKEKIKNLTPEQKKKIKKGVIIGSIAVVLIVVIVVLSVVLTSKFRIAKVSQVELGMTQEEVKSILGEPDFQYKTAVYSTIPFVDVYIWYESKARKIVNKINANSNADAEDWDDLDKGIEKEAKLLEKLNKMKFKSIVVAFDRTKNTVIDVALNTKTKFDDEEPYASVEQKSVKSISMNKSILQVGETKNKVAYTVKYADGSYRKGYLDNCDVTGFNTSAEGPIKVSFDNYWAKHNYTFSVRAANVVVATNNSSYGSVSGSGYYQQGETVTLTATPRNEDYVFLGWYDGTTLVSSDSTYQFNWTSEKELEAVFSLKSMTNFVYETVAGGYKITGVRDTSMTSLIIPNEVVEIAQDAFSSCRGITHAEASANFLSAIPKSELREVVITGGTSIGDSVFSGCFKLTRITIPNSVTSIGQYAFSSCTSLTSVTIGDGVTSIGNNAFYYCTSLASITIPDSVTSIGSNAFYNCCSLMTVTIGDSVTSIGEYAFFACYKLVEVYNKSSLSITKGNTSNGYVGYYAKAIYTAPYESKLSTDEDGYILYADGEEISLIGYTGTDTELTLPTGITEINQCAFLNDEAITSITIPDGVTSIGDYAFDNCTSLTSITIPDSVASISRYAFYKCTKLKSVTIGSGVTSIGDSVFNNCYSLTSVYYTGNIASWFGITFSDYYANPLYYAHNLYINNELVTDLVIPNGVTEIKAYAFDGATCLTSVTIPGSVTSIGNGAFFNCDSLTSVYYTGDIASWCGITFGYNANPLSYAHNLYINNELVTDVVIPSGVTEIKQYAFAGASFGSVTIPDSVTSIGNYAFSGCPIETATIPAMAISYILNGALQSVTITSGTSIEIAFSGCTALTSITIPDSVTSIRNYAFYGCTSLTSVTIPDSVTSIGEYAFRYCTSLTNITIPDSVTSIGVSAFRDCTSLTSITIPDSVTSIGEYAFSGCYKLVEVYNKSSLNIIEGSLSNGYVGRYAKAVYTEPYESKISTDENGYILYTDGEEISLIGYTGTDTELTLPTGITEINKYAFYQNERITSITIPDGVTSIGYYAFCNCTNLTSVYYTGDIASWCGITFGSSALSYAHNLYINNELVTDLVIPNGETEIKDYAFYGATCLTSVTIPDSVTSIGFDAFYGCTSLTSVTIGNSVTSIGNYAFHGCTSLTSVTIPDSVTSIGYGAFLGCTSLTSITIPDGVTSIGSYAFGDCTSLTSITFEGTKEQWDAITKGEQWNYNTGAYRIYCTNVTIQK